MGGIIGKAPTYKSNRGRIKPQKVFNEALKKFKEKIDSSEIIKIKQKEDKNGN